MQSVSKKDFLDEVIAERSRRDDAFEAKVEAALERRRLLRALAKRRAKSGLTQQAVAARMGTSQPMVARLESGEVDAKLSTIERYAAAVETRVSWRLVGAKR